MNSRQPCRCKHCNTEFCHELQTTLLAYTHSNAECWHELWTALLAHTLKCYMLTRTVGRLAGNHTVMLYLYCYLNCAAYCVCSLSTVQQTGSGHSLVWCCCELTKHKYQHHSATLSVLLFGTSHFVFCNVLWCKCKHIKRVFLHSWQVTSFLFWLWTRTGSPWPTGQLLE